MFPTKAFDEVSDTVADEVADKVSGEGLASAAKVRIAVPLLESRTTKPRDRGLSTAFAEVDILSAGISGGSGEPPGSDSRKI